MFFFSFENVASFYSSGGLVFGIVNIVGNFGAVFADQAYKYLLSQPLLSDQFSGQFSSPGLLAIRCGHKACQGDVIKKKQCDFLPDKKRLTKDKLSWP